MRCDRLLFELAAVAFILLVLVCLLASLFTVVPDHHEPPADIVGHYLAWSSDKQHDAWLLRVLIWKDSDGKLHAEWRNKSGRLYCQGQWVRQEDGRWLETYDQDVSVSQPTAWRVVDDDPLTIDMAGDPGWRLQREKEK